MKKPKTVRIACQGADVLALDALTPYQGNLKRISADRMAKLKAQIVQRGFSAPFFVWRDGQTNYVLDGHQRLAALTELAAEGWAVPPLPVVWVEAADAGEAKRKLLAFASQFGEVTSEGLSDFLSEADFALGDLRQLEFPEIDMIAFAESIKEDWLSDADISEDSEKLSRFIDARKESRAQFKDRTEVNFWLCLVFESHAQKWAFLDKFPALETRYGMYVDGVLLAEAIGITLPQGKERTEKPHVEQKLAQRTLKEGNQDARS